MASISALASPCSAVLPLPKLPPLSPGAQFSDTERRAGEIVLGVKIGIHRQIGFDPLEPRDDAGERADMLAESCDGVARRDTAVAAARHHQLVAGGQRQRRRSTARVAQFLAAAAWTLRTLRDVMLHHARSQEIETDDVIAQIGAEIGGNCFCDLERGELNSGLSERLFGERRNGDAVRALAVDKRSDLAVAPHAVGKTCPARAFSRREDRADERENAVRLRKQPTGMIGQMPLVQFGQMAVEIVGGQRYGQIGTRGRRRERPISATPQ